jgi:hypothetical protein
MTNKIPSAYNDAQLQCESTLQAFGLTLDEEGHYAERGSHVIARFTAFITGKT